LFDVSPIASALSDAFSRDLRAAGWQETARSASGTTLQRGRHLIVMTARADGVVIWNVFPATPPAGSPLAAAFTSQTAVPVGSFLIAGVDPQLDVSSQSLDRTGRFVREPFFRGDARSVFAKLHEESARRVDEFVRTVEQQG
jgi:hypothetical protein